MRIIPFMSQRPSSGQALPEYLLTVAVLTLVFWAGVRVWVRALDNAEAEQAWYVFLPSP